MVLLLFLGGAVVGTVSLAVAAWRAGFPRVPAVLLALFQFVDLGLPGHTGTVVAHTVLLVALAWFATYLWADTSGETQDGAVVGEVDAGRRRVAG